MRNSSILSFIKFRNANMYVKMCTYTQSENMHVICLKQQLRPWAPLAVFSLFWQRWCCALRGAAVCYAEFQCRIVSATAFQTWSLCYLYLPSPKAFRWQLNMWHKEPLSRHSGHAWVFTTSWIGRRPYSAWFRKCGWFLLLHRWFERQLYDPNQSKLPVCTLPL